MAFDDSSYHKISQILPAQLIRNSPPNQVVTNIKIVPCVEGDRSDCQREATSANGGCRGLTIRSVTLNMGHDCFYYTERLSFTHLLYLCTLGPFVKRKE